MKAVDMKGREIKAGDTIAYALTVGRSANMAIYRVDAVIEVEQHGYYRPTGAAEHESRDADADADGALLLYGAYTSTKLKATKVGESYGWRDGKSRQATLAMADDRALVINETAATWGLPQ